MKAAQRLTTSDFNELLLFLARIIEQDPPQLIYQEGILPNIKVKLHNPKTNETTEQSQFIFPVLTTAIAQAVSVIFNEEKPINVAVFIHTLKQFFDDHGLFPFIIPCVFRSGELDLNMYFFMKIPKEIQDTSILDWPVYFKANIKSRIKTNANPSGFYIEYGQMCYEYAQIISSILLGVSKVAD